MNNFCKLHIYCKANKCCFDDIKESKKPTIIININSIVSLEETTDWGFCDNYWKYKYRKLTMNNSDSYLVPADEGDKLEKILLENNKKQKI